MGAKGLYGGIEGSRGRRLKNEEKVPKNVYGGAREEMNGNESAQSVNFRARALRYRDDTVT